MNVRFIEDMLFDGSSKMMPYEEVAHRTQQRPPSLLACTHCRKRHQRCDAQMPVCGRCDRRKLVCVYVESKRGYKPRKKQIQNGTAISGAGADAEAEAEAEVEYEDYDDGEPDPSSKPSDGSVLATYAWPAAAQEDTNTPATTASSAESVPRLPGFGIPDKPVRTSHQAADLIDIFYSSFFPAHTFVVPRALLLQCSRIIPEELKAVFRYVGSHFQHTESQDALRKAAFEIVISGDSIDPVFKIQGLLCLAIVFMAGRLERALGMNLLAEAIDLALSIGLHRSAFPTGRPLDHPILAESWRRTYWDLYVVDTLLSSLDGSNYRSRLRDVATDLPVPAQSDDYVNCRVTPAAPTLQEMADRVFAETSFDYSSGAYKIEATRILGTVFTLEADTFSVTNSQVESIDASIQAFLLSLPPSFREIVEIDGKVDEVLFAAHMIIHWASIALHRPRSNLPYVHNHYRTACSADESVGIPALAFQSHTAKAISAANSISRLTAIQTPLALHTPCFACVVALSTMVHLPAYTLQQDKAEIRERLHLSVSALAAIGEIWPLASVVRAQVAQFARETFKTNPVSASVAPATSMPLITDAPQQQECDLDAMLNDDSWLIELDAFAGVPVPREMVYASKR